MTMEGSYTWQHKTLIGELIEGMELAKQLKQNLAAKASPETREFLLQRILSSYDKALLILKWSGSITQSQPQQRALAVLTSVSVPESPISVTDSPRSDGQSFARDGGSKKRKALPKWTEQVRVSSENGLEGPQDDGFSWRKYGQKDILQAKFPRSYYRCTFRNTQSCWATKQVQRTDEDPFLFDITYSGSHTCSQAGSSVQPPTSPQMQDQKPNAKTTVHQHHLLEGPARNSSFSFPASQHLACLEVEEGFNNPLGSFSQSFMSPSTPESSYYTVSPFQINRSAGFHVSVRRSDSDLTEIISAETSATNSPIPELEFSLDDIEIVPNLSFDKHGFFT